MKTIGFIGTGNMSKAIIEGLMAAARAGSDLVSAEDVVVFNRTNSKAEAIAAQYAGMVLAETDLEVMAAAKYIVLGMKPHQHEEVIGRLRHQIKPEQVIVTIAAGLDIKKIRYWFGDDVKVARTMPNTPAKVGCGMTAIAYSDNVQEDERAFVEAMMSSFGKAEVIEEKLMDMVPAISGSAPAYFFLIMEAMGDEAVRQGMSRDQAYRMAAQAMVGAGNMLLETGLHPGVLKDQVTSPGGTTIEAVKTLEHCGVRSAMMKAMEACTNKVEVMKSKM